MKMRRTLLAVAAVVALAAAGAGAWLITANSRRGTAIAAKVNSEAIYWSQVDAELERFAAQFGGTSNPEFDKQRAELSKTVLDQLVLQRLVLQEARKRSLMASDKDVEDQLAVIKRQFPNEQAFGAALSRERLSLIALRDLIRFRLSQRRVGEAVTTDLKVTDEELKAQFDNDRASYDRPAQIKASHILFRIADKEQEAVAQAKAKLAQAALADGQKFEDVAKKYSEDPGSAQNGGDLGYVGKGTLVKEFEDVAWSLKPGQMSGLVRTQYGLHIIKVTDARSAAQAQFEKVKDEVREKLLAAKREKAFEAWLEELRKAAKIEKFDRK